MWISFDKDEDVEWLVKEFAKKKPRKLLNLFLEQKKSIWSHFSKYTDRVGFRGKKRALLLNLCSVRLNLLQKELVCNYEKKTREPCKASKHHYTCAQKHWYSNYNKITSI